MGRRIMIATGGTGGHIFPAIALAQQLSVEDPSCEVVFVGGGLSENRYFDRGSYESYTVSCGSFVSRDPSKVALAVGKIARGIWQSRVIIKKFNPSVVVGFGSFYTFPPLVAARLLSVPIVLHESNSIPGKTTRLMSRWAALTGVQFPETVHLLNGNVLEVGMPLRAGFQQGSATKEAARSYFGLDMDWMVILVFGGSQGSKAINEALLQTFCAIKHLPFQIIHIVGDTTLVRKVSHYYATHGIKASVKAFESRMDLAWQAADCVISRAGAGTIAELIEFEVPALLIPYPQAAEDHQTHNANFIAATVGGGMKLAEKEVTVERLSSTLSAFLCQQNEILAGMRRAIRLYKSRARMKNLVTIVKEFD